MLSTAPLSVPPFAVSNSDQSLPSPEGRNIVVAQPDVSVPSRSASQACSHHNDRSRTPRKCLATLQDAISICIVSRKFGDYSSCRRDDPILLPRDRPRGCTFWIPWGVLLQVQVPQFRGCDSDSCMFPDVLILFIFTFGLWSLTEIGRRFRGQRHRNKKKKTRKLLNGLTALSTYDLMTRTI
ncbi:hypothetical protein BS47DRAFT_111423 [Hydnum rufescens UP504]|uniref:Uncharacterized protein n=1 Tax=Hydnum rufescens UP504 TaxID=1448309 RepID=A0A9P6AQH0_9AGAM|nr:hypothetical protein BS47DRAFT_111423 [Hydnum rufescens UP504]